MVRVLSRSFALLFAVALVGAMAITLAIAVGPPIRDDFSRIDCFCGVTVRPSWEAAHAWKPLIAPAFTVRAPSGTELKDLDDFTGTHGRIVHPAFVLTWQSGAAIADGSDLRALSAYSEEPVSLAGGYAVLRRAYQAGRGEPWRLAMFVPRTGATGGLLFEGAYATSEQRDLAEEVLRSLVLFPILTAPEVVPPSIEIATP